MNTHATDPLSLAHYYCPIYRPRSVVLSHGKGARLWDVNEKEYVDFASGIAVCGLGYDDSDIQEALVYQAKRLWHTSNIFYSEPPLRLAQELVEASGFAQHVFLCNSGAEANEAAIKFVRKWAASQNIPPERRVIVTCHGGFHGRTLAAVTATAQAKYHAGFEPLPAGFRYIPFNDSAALNAALAQGDVAGVLLEPLQGEGGVVPASPGYLAEVRKLCDKYNALLVLDEIQCGLGRTGQLFAHWKAQISPDILTLAKGLAVGFPIGATLLGPRLEKTLHFGDHGTTFGGNPMAAAVARVVLQKLRSPQVMENVHRQSQTIRKRLEKLSQQTSLFSQVRGEGLMLGAVLHSGFSGKAAEILDLAAHHGLLLLQAGPDVLRFVPPLTLTDDECAIGLDRLEYACNDYLERAKANNIQCI